MDKSLILNNIKKHLNIRFDKDFANFLEIKPTALAMWHKRNTYDIELIFTKCDFLNPVWLITGQGQMLQKEVDTFQEPSSEYQNFISKTDRVESNQMIPLYDLDAVAGVIPVILDMNNQKPIDHIYIPNAPKCDGAMYATGDSMYPLLKSGDILAFKTITDFTNDVFFGEMYILFIEVAGDLFRTVKFVHKGEEKNHFKLVSQNKHHQDKDIHISKIRAMAQVKASIRIH
ncbi:peptidase S24 [Tenacibaculum pacificus]|uniref:S24 family peptidase n=1 Tax=Tenacibaculum pacificus TaxID=3018314 RepID=UPI0022F3930F|nr:S24 family peptidase [Tenacibaculum pacificus]WBX72929.1 peptidase S24 [Tenacibaculum pacificus]